MCFNKRLTLLALRPSTGRAEPLETARAVVWADVSDVGTVTKLEAMAVGLNLSLTAVMWRREFKSYTHAEYGGVRYRIASTGSAQNDLHIKLSLERG